MKFLLVILPLLLAAESISDKKASFSDSSQVKENDAVFLNKELSTLKSNLERLYSKAQVLALEKKDTADFKAVLEEVNELRRKKDSLEEAWRKASSEESAQDGEPYALWDQEEITLAQLVMEYGSSDYLYIIPSEFSSFKIHLHSNIPIPRQSWTDLLEVMLYHQGFGLKKLNPFAKQLYMLKQDIGSVQTIAYRPQHVALAPSRSRICYLLVPPVEQVRSIFQFFEKFSDNKQTFVHQLNNKIAIVGIKEDIQRLLEFYEKVWGIQGGKVTRVVSVAKMSVREMEKILQSFFNEALEKSRMPLGRQEQESLGIFSIPASNSLILMGAKESVDRAEKIIKETEDQLEDPAEMTIHFYTCKHSDPVDIAQILEKVYLSLVHASQEMAPRETEVTYSSQVQGNKAPPEGYPPMPPLVVAPPPLKPGIASKVDIEVGPSAHFIPDPKTGTILMTVRRDSLPKIKDLLKKLDVPKKMVQIEVLMFERRLQSQNNYGLNLLKLGKTRNGVTYISSAPPHVSHEKPVPGVLQFFFHGPSHKYTPHFDIAYNFLLTQDDIQLNAAPSVVTVNQTPATISIVEEISINNGAAPIDTNKGTSFEKSFARANYGIIIVMNPTIHTPDEDGTMPSVTLKTNITFDTTKPHPDDRPLVDRRHIENEVRVLDGETIIIGGLRRKSRTDHEEKVPFLGDIPGIGKLFGTTQLADQDTEMVFFITPKIISDPKQEADKIRTEELKKRPGDTPEFLKYQDEAFQKEKEKFFRNSLKNLYNNDR